MKTRKKYFKKGSKRKYFKKGVKRKTVKRRSRRKTLKKNIMKKNKIKLKKLNKNGGMKGVMNYFLRKKPIEEKKTDSNDLETSDGFMYMISKADYSALSTLISSNAEYGTCIYCGKEFEGDKRRLIEHATTFKTICTSVTKGEAEKREENIKKFDNRVEWLKEFYKDADVLNRIK